MNCGKNKSWLMMLGCMLPIIILVAAPFVAPLIGIKSQYLNVLAVLACPLTMAIMMLMNKDENKNN